MSFPEIEALKAQYDAFGELLGSLGAGDWDVPTRCDPLNVRDIVTHVIYPMPLVSTLFDAAEPEAANTDRYLRWRREDRNAPEEIVEHIREVVDHVRDDAARVRFFEEHGPKLLRAFASRAPERLVAYGPAVMRLDDLTTTGNIETGVHHMDIQHALGREESLHPLAGPIIRDVLDGIAGTCVGDVVDWDDTTYALIGTGRRPLSDADRPALGATADAFPLIT